MDNLKQNEVVATLPSIKKVTSNSSNMHSDNLGQLAIALSQVQQEMRSIKKGSEGYGYSYTNLAEMADYVLPLLGKNGLAVSQFTDEDNNLITMLIHKSGEFIKGKMKLLDDIEMKGVNIAQKKGSVLSYFRRYALGAITGLTSNDEDVDASSKGAFIPETKPKRSTKFVNREEVTETKGGKKDDFIGGF